MESSILSVASYNLCQQTDKEDLEIILQKVLDYTPDVISLQGLTKSNCEQVFRILKSQGYQYARFDQSGHPRVEFEILFSKEPVLNKGYMPFIKSYQNRGISKFFISAASRSQHPFNVCIYTSRFESEGRGNTLRKTQVVEMAAEREKDNLDCVIFIGDTCIPSWQESAIRCPEGWNDAWRMKGTSKNEKTTLYDRTDQIWYYGNVKPLEFSLIKIDNTSETRAGVFAKFEYIGILENIG